MRVDTSALPAQLTLLLEHAGRALGFSPPFWDAAHLLAGDGSDRKFFRLRRSGEHYIALLSPRQKAAGVDENDSYFRIGRHLQGRGIDVPQILWADLERGYFLLEDRGDYHLQRHARRGRVDLGRLYRRALQLLVKVHARAPEGFQASYCFDTARYTPDFVYERELEYFRRAFLVGYLGLEIGPDDLRADFENLAEAAAACAPSLVMHRDFQSRNLLVWKETLWLIDFQGMRFGPPTYDLASLLLDPYVMIPQRLQEDLVGLYWLAARRLLRCSPRQFRDSYEAVRLSRNLQVLGAYGYLGVVKGKRHFLQFIPRAWQQLCGWFAGRDPGRYPRLRCCLEQVRCHKAQLVEKPADRKSFA